MVINDDLRRKIGLALNEATLLGVDFEEEHSRVACTFSVVSIDEHGVVPDDTRLLFIFQPVGRFVASYRNGSWDDELALPEKFSPNNILKIIQGFNGQSIYGWDFINCGDKNYDTWKDRLSFDYMKSGSSGLSNTIDLFQEKLNTHLDIRIWFDDFEIVTPDYKKIELEEFLNNGKRGWDAIYSNDNKMDKFGIIPSTKENQQKLQKSFEQLTEEKSESWWKKLKGKWQK